jgi:mono/diheme cytochrome c family protein
MAPSPVVLTPLLLAPLLFAGCTYEPDTWKSPLATGFSGTGDAVQGQEIFEGEHWEDDTPYALTCASCHHPSENDTLEVDDDAVLNRPGHTVYNVSLRGEWKNGQSWNLLASDQLGAFGGQICVDVYFPGESAMTAEQAAHLEAYLKTRADAEADPDDPRAQPLGVEYTEWTTRDAFLADIGSATGADLGDVEAGAALAARHCGSCHATGEGGALAFYTVATLSTDQILARIRRTTVNGVEHSNSRMPRLPATRLPDEALRDLLAWLTAT